MKKENFNLMPWAGVFLAVLLYIASINYRGLMTAGEYDFAVMLKSFFPWVSGTVMPKLPAALATLFTAGLLWLTAAKLHLLHPGNAAGFYLCFPPVWWLGTSASAAPLLALAVSLAAAGLFITRRSSRIFEKSAALIAGITGAAAAALIAQSRFFSWSGVVLAFMPVIFLTFAVYLDKLELRALAGRRLNRMALTTAVIFAMILIYFLLPSLARMLKVDLPAGLTTLSYGQSVYRPAIALLIPFFWIYLVLKSDKTADKGFFLCFAVGFVMLTLPPAVPWRRLASIPDREELAQMLPEISRYNPIFFADDSTRAAISYVTGFPVRSVGRSSDDLPPDQLAAEIKEALHQGDVIVVYANGELDSFLPEDLSAVKFNSRQNCKIFRYSGEQK